MKRKELLILSIGIFFTVIALLVADIYHVNIQAKVKDQTGIQQLEDYKISGDLLNQLEKMNP